MLDWLFWWVEIKNASVQAAVIGFGGTLLVIVLGLLNYSHLKNKDRKARSEELDREARARATALDTELRAREHERKTEREREDKAREERRQQDRERREKIVRALYSEIFSKLRIAENSHAGWSAKKIKDKIYAAPADQPWHPHIVVEPYTAPIFDAHVAELWVLHDVASIQMVVEFYRLDRAIHTAMAALASAEMRALVPERRAFFIDAITLLFDRYLVVAKEATQFLDRSTDSAGKEAALRALEQRRVSDFSQLEELVRQQTFGSSYRPGQPL